MTVGQVPAAVSVWGVGTHRIVPLLVDILPAFQPHLCTYTIRWRLAHRLLYLWLPIVNEITYPETIYPTKHNNTPPHKTLNKPSLLCRTPLSPLSRSPSPSPQPISPPLNIPTTPLPSNHPPTCPIRPPLPPRTRSPLRSSTMHLASHRHICAIHSDHVSRTTCLWKRTPT